MRFNSILESILWCYFKSESTNILSWMIRLSISRVAYKVQELGVMKKMSFKVVDLFAIETSQYEIIFTIFNSFATSSKTIFAIYFVIGMLSKPNLWRTLRRWWGVPRWLVIIYRQRNLKCKNHCFTVIDFWHLRPLLTTTVFLTFCKSFPSWVKQ